MDITRDELKSILREILQEELPVGETPLGEKWIGGRVYIEPRNDELQGKEIPIEAFFHKVVMIRDRLRVLEQNINSNKKLGAEDKIHLQQYITKIYGSLTTFNVLFADKSQYFVGDSSKVK